MRIYGENDKEGKMRWCEEVQERLSVQRETVREEVFLSEQAATSKEKTRRTWKPGAADVTANHFPWNRVRSSSLMQRHQGNGWCGADMLP